MRFESEPAAGDRSDLPHEPCECRCEPSDIAPLRPPARALAPEFPSDLEFSKLAARPLLVFAGGGAGERSRSRGASPFLTADIILYVFHILRC